MTNLRMIRIVFNLTVQECFKIGAKELMIKWVTYQNMLDSNDDILDMVNG